MESKQRDGPETFQTGLSISQNLFPKASQRSLQNIHQSKEVEDYTSMRTPHTWHLGCTLVAWQHGLSETTNDIHVIRKKHQCYSQHSVVAHSGHDDAKGILLHMHLVV